MTTVKEFEMDNGCLICISHKPSSDGRSYIYENRKPISYSRLKYKMEKGEIPKGMVVFNTCGDVNCGNPDHMELITREEFASMNIINKRNVDSYLKSTNTTEEQVIDIYTAPPSISHTTLAKKYGVTPSKIADIRNGKTFSEITDCFESPLFGVGLVR